MEAAGQAMVQGLVQIYDHHHAGFDRNANRAM